MKNENSINYADFYLGRVTQFFIDHPDGNIQGWQVHKDAIPSVMEYLLQENRTIEIQGTWFGSEFQTEFLKVSSSHTELFVNSNDGKKPRVFVYDGTDEVITMINDFLLKCNMNNVVFRDSQTNRLYVNGKYYNVGEQVVITLN